MTNNFSCDTIKLFTGILCFKPQKEKEDKRNPPYSKEKGAIHFNRMPENTVPSGKRAVLSPPVSRRQESPAAKPRAANSSQAGPQLSKRPRRETPEKTRRLPPQDHLPSAQKGFLAESKNFHHGAVFGEAGKVTAAEISKLQ